MATVAQFLCLQFHVLLCSSTVFLRSDAAATIYFAARFVRLLFKGSVYFSGKPGDIDDGLDKVCKSEVVTVARRCQ